MKSRAVLLVLALLGLLASACGPIDGDGQAQRTDDDGHLDQNSPYVGMTTSDDRPRLGGRLIYGLPADTNSWNPSVAQWGAYSLEVSKALFDTLFTYDADGTPQPNLVMSYEHNEDYTVWTVTLRPGIRFHNGKPLTAASIVETNEYFRASTIIGGAYHLTALDHADVIDELTYRLYTSKPWPTMRDSGTSPLSVAADLEWLKGEDWAHPVGTGPFKIESWTLEHSLVVTRNRDYWRSDRWGNKLPYLDSIEFRVMPSDLERANALRAGHLDIMMQTLPTAELAELRKECRARKLQCFSDEKGETPENFVVLNTSKPPFNDLDARKALAMAVNRDDYVQRVTGGESKPADGIHAPGSPWYTASTYPGYDQDGARRLADAVKARNGGTFAFELMGAANEEATRIMQYLQASWKAVGIDAAILSSDNQSKIRRQILGEYQASVTQAFDNPHPAINMAFLDTTQTKPGQATLVFSRLDDAELGDRIESVVRQPTNDGWVVGNALVMERLNQLVPFIWLDHAPRTIIARSNVVNVVEATLPDGQVAADFTGGAHALSQIWLRPS
jgi:peptide/nickel transport system substrate-binding protein